MADPNPGFMDQLRTFERSDIFKKIDFPKNIAKTCDKPL